MLAGAILIRGRLRAIVLFRRSVAVFVYLVLHFPIDRIQLAGIRDESICI